MNLEHIASRVVETREQDALRSRYRDDPVLWASQVAGIHLWSLQADVARSVAENKDTAVKAGHGVGKSLLAALLVCWWIDTRYPNCFVVSTAPSTAQISAIVWREIANIAGRVEKRYKEGLVDHKLPGYRTSGDTPQWKMDDGTVIGFGRKPPDQRVDDAVQGIHAQDGVLAIGDEAVGLTEEMIDALGNITSTSSSRRLLICNPTNPASYVGRLFKDKPANWTFKTISVLDSPNFTGEEVPEEARQALTDQSYVDAKREEYGEGTPRWQSRVLGEFAWDMGYSLIRPEDIKKGCETLIDPDGKIAVLGVDVSRSKAGDMNTVYVNRGGNLRFVEAWNSANALTTAERIHQIAMMEDVSEVRIDGAGLGGPIADNVSELSNGEYGVIEILGGDASPDKKRFYNMRAYLWNSVLEGLRAGSIDLDPADDSLHEELMSVEIKKRVSGNDSLLLASKEEIRRSGLGKSPDLADAAVYALADLSAWTGNPLNQLKPGDKVVLDPSEVMQADTTDWYAGNYATF